MPMEKTSIKRTGAVFARSAPRRKDSDTTEQIKTVLESSNTLVAAQPEIKNMEVKFTTNWLYYKLQKDGTVGDLQMPQRLERNFFKAIDKMFRVYTVKHHEIAGDSEHLVVAVKLEDLLTINPGASRQALEARGNVQDLAAKGIMYLASRVYVKNNYRTRKCRLIGDANRPGPYLGYYVDVNPNDCRYNFNPQDFTVLRSDAELNDLIYDVHENGKSGSCDRIWVKYKKHTELKNAIVRNCRATVEERREKDFETHMNAMYEGKKKLLMKAGECEQNVVKMLGPKQQSWDAKRQFRKRLPNGIEILESLRSIVAPKATQSEELQMAHMQYQVSRDDASVTSTAASDKTSSSGSTLRRQSPPVEEYLPMPALSALAQSQTPAMTDFSSSTTSQGQDWQKPQAVFLQPQDCAAPVAPNGYSQPSPATLMDHSSGVSQGQQYWQDQQFMAYGGVTQAVPYGYVQQPAVPCQVVCHNGYPFMVPVTGPIPYGFGYGNVPLIPCAAVPSHPQAPTNQAPPSALMN